jgi:tripartite-type tricarboxylate transporter receptor subunit TctC
MNLVKLNNRGVHRRRIPSLAPLFVLALVVTTPSAPAQPYPTKPVRVIVPFVPGGGVDFAARLIAQKLPEFFGQQVVVENRGGAGGVLGVEAGVKSAPDGYTLIMISSSYPVSPSLYKINYDPIADITPVIMVATGPFVIVVHPSLPVKTTQELIALAKARPGQINYASSGTGGGVHLATELFLYMAGAKMNHIPYKGTGPAMTDTIAGQTNLIFGSVAAALPMVKAGRLRAIAVTTAQRIAAEPAIPTVAESGLPGYETYVWQALIGPKGLPRPVVERIHADVTKVLAQKEMEERLRSEGLTAGGGTPQQLLAIIRREIDVWRKVVARAGIRVE